MEHSIKAAAETENKENAHKQYLLPVARCHTRQASLLKFERRLVSRHLQCPEIRVGHITSGRTAAVAPSCNAFDNEALLSCDCFGERRYKVVRWLATKHPYDTKQLMSIQQLCTK